ncbi:hypothetical protein YB2330_003786 [Saitoella coloradoensis]
MTIAPIPSSSLSGVKLAYATPSLGMHENHTLPLKVKAASKYGYAGVEMGFDDLCSYAKQTYGDEFKGEDDTPTLVKTAEKVYELCQELKLEVICLQPFSDFEGITDPTERTAKFQTAKNWMAIMRALHTPMLQIGSTDNPSRSSSYTTIASDLRELADLIAAEVPNGKIAYEPWCWGAWIDTWRGCWEICKLVDRPNFGLCLDTFQSVGREWADPTSESGRIEEGGITEEKLTARLQYSMDELAKTVDPEKIFYFQISDAYHMQPPLTPDHEEMKANEGTPARGVWSHAFRPLPFDDELKGSKKGYLPIKECLKAVFATGWRGWVSMEVFEGEEMGKEDESVPDEWARRGKKSWDGCVAAMAEE